MGNDFTDLLYSTLKSQLSVCRTTSNRDEIVIRCVYCGDSIKSPSSAHFYIQAYHPYHCYCQRCGISRSISTEFLDDFKIKNEELRVAVIKLQKERKYQVVQGRKRGNNKLIESLVSPTNDFVIPDYKGTKGELRRLEYVNNRLGLELNLFDAKKLNMILNFKEFIVTNDITLTNVQVIEKLSLLNKHCVGFLSQDKNFIVFRSLDPEVTGFRYYNYNITGKRDNTRKYYTIKQNINLMNPNVKIIITEGIMDLLSVYYNIYKGKIPDGQNIVFMSTNGIGMGHVINTVCKLGFLNPEIEIYADNGVNIKTFKNIKNVNPYITDYNKIKIFYNKLAKDVGVRPEEIDLKYTFI